MASTDPGHAAPGAAGSVLPPAAIAANPAPTGGPIAREFAAAAANAAPGGASSMADTLLTAFGQGDAGVPANVREAYGRIRALGL
jgi:hypothetical protein